jgi:hypothetical protein
VDLSVRVCMDKQLFKITPIEGDSRIDINSPLSNSTRITGSDLPSTPQISIPLLSTTVADSTVILGDDMHIDEDEIEGDVDVMCIDNDTIPNRSKRFRPACMPLLSQLPPPSTQDILSRSEPIYTYIYIYIYIYTYICMYVYAYIYICKQTCLTLALVLMI